MNKPPGKTNIMCKYNNVIFDFDSTLIRFESLELVMAELLQGDQSKIQQIEILTNAGMNGEMSFRDSLEARLKVAKPTKAALNAFVAQHCPDALTVGVKKLIEQLHQQDVKVWIISGGFSELILPFAEYLGIPASRVFTVNLHWDDKGYFDCLNNDNGFCDSKVTGAAKIQDQLAGKTVIVGDGFTDYELYNAGIANDFIAYVEHVQRDKVLSVAKLCAKNIDELSTLIGN
ncbi:HAD-IB family phosphatase [Cysteiniphilum halobium]|uniref:HAD-IB family phosphatase n=1 Tax=Cysteiniphilum halobium TaxID=2219059 RepID=UPI001F15F002|nr:HAD-IB family phosphatase [Cysteiniphilum halobium]